MTKSKRTRKVRAANQDDQLRLSDAIKVLFKGHEMITTGEKCMKAAMDKVRVTGLLDFTLTDGESFLSARYVEKLLAHLEPVMDGRTQ